MPANHSKAILLPFLVIPLIALFGTHARAQEEPTDEEEAEHAEPAEPARQPSPGITSAVPREWIRVGPSDSEFNIEVENPYEGDTDAISEGERLFGWYHCSGCHASAGGGALGPTLRDEDLVYGSDPLSIFHSIWYGRPEGMPTWAGKIPENEIWKIVALIQSWQEQPDRLADE